jgi:hypothetical protein
VKEASSRDGESACDESGGVLLGGPRGGHRA